jgi:hypothetical protein
MARNKELFTPDSIDDDIDTLMDENHSLFPDLNVQFLHELRSISKDDAASLKRVWERLEHYSRQQNALQELSLQTPQGQEDDFYILPLQSWRQNKRRISTRSLFTVLAAALTGLFLVSSLGWILAIRYPATPAASRPALPTVPMAARVLDLSSHSVSSASSSSKPEPVVTPPVTPTASLLLTAAPTSPSPSGYWKFDEGSGSTAHDSSGDNYTGTLQGNASWAKGKIGPYALSLDGSSNTDVDIPATVVDTTKSYTFTAWVLLTNTSNHATAISIDGNQMSGEYLQFNGGGFCFCAFDADSSNSNLYMAATSYTPNTNQWYHLAGVYDAKTKTLALYVNGSIVQSIAYPGAWKASGHTLIGRGKYEGNLVDFWPGLIDDVRFYQTALSASDIQALANGGGN